MYNKYMNWILIIIILIKYYDILIFYDILIEFGISS